MDRYIDRKLCVSWNLTFCLNSKQYLLRKIKMKAGSTINIVEMALGRDYLG
jgi:hypothetical protein